MIHAHHSHTHTDNKNKMTVKIAHWTVTNFTGNLRDNMVKTNFWINYCAYKMLDRQRQTVDESLEVLRKKTTLELNVLWVSTAIYWKMCESVRPINLPLSRSAAAMPERVYKRWQIWSCQCSHPDYDFPPCHPAFCCPVWSYSWLFCLVPFRYPQPSITTYV